MSKYKVGDKVRIVSERTGSRWNGDGKMDKWLGKIMTVKEVASTYYKMVEDAGERGGTGWNWFSYMIEGLANESHHSIHITCTDNKTTHAIKKVDGKNVARSKAVCCPSDTFDFDVGANLAYDRLMRPETLEKAQPKQPKQEGKPKFKIGDKVKFVKAKYDFKDHLVGRTYEIKNIQGACEDGFRYGIGESFVAFESELEPYTEPESTEPKQEPVKLYCVEADEGYLTKGKIYEMYLPGKLVYDCCETASTYESLDALFRHYDKWKKRLVPLVSRPAKVGEYALVTNSDGTASNKYKNGDILRAIRRSGSEEPGFVYKEDCFTVYSIFDTEYLVLDGYTEPEKCCENCKEICIINKSPLYAYCPKKKKAFEHFQEDTRTSSCESYEFKGE